MMPRSRGGKRGMAPTRVAESVGRCAAPRHAPDQAILSNALIFALMSEISISVA